MPVTVVVTRDVEARYRGFLASVMLEVAPGVYVGSDISKGVRERIWTVVAKWFGFLGRGAITMVYRDASASGNLRVRQLGDPPKEIWDADGVLLVRHNSADPPNSPFDTSEDSLPEQPR
ncbi:type I-E CRISPR-associated endoribonuclease Cas2e [Candidatus Palauibacter sp.]|uniref:type I-E CRISPR-associated endoribonuclease Cas2e n=1 Tax=Candidatus Palauibacter sp. TaxID=3101350 RepID=UPI003AF2AC5B